MSKIPNHCSNSLTVEGPGAEDFFAEITGNESDNFINTLIPIPAIMVGICSGGALIDGERVTEWRDGPDGKAVAISAVDRQIMTDLYGCTNSYDFAVRHWGTKWGAYDVTVVAPTILFDSAWSPPEKAIQTISEMYPDATFELAYAEGGAAYWGRTTYKDGEAIDYSFNSEEFWKPPTMSAAGEIEEDEDGDIMDSLTNECYTHIDKYGLHTGG